TLLVTGLAPLTSGDNWELPVVQCADTQWLETQTQVSVFEPLELNRVQVRGGRQTHVGALATPVPATTFQAQFHAADGRLVVSVAPPPSRLRAIVGSTVTLETSTMTARVVADCTVLAGRLTQLEAELPRAWVVDGVDLDPDALLEDFDVTAIDDERQRLSIRLTAPLTRERTARVLLRAHRPRPADDAWLTRDQFRLLTFVGPAGGAVEGRHLVSVQNDLPAHLHWSDDRDVVWRTPSELTQGEAELVDSRPGNWLYIDDAGAAELAARLAGADGTYSADMALTARVTSGQLSESYRIRLEPRETPVSRVVVLFSQARATPPTWSSDSPAAGLFSARRLSDGELQTVSRWAEEGWELQFRASLAEPFTLRMDRSTPWQPLLPLSLIALSEADTQSGGVIVEGEGIRLTIESTGVETRPLASTNPLRVETRVAAFRYDPKNSPLIVLREADDPRGDRRVWAWSSQLGTLVAREGETAHEAVYLLENHGADQIEFSLPHGSRLNQVLVDGQEPPRNAATTDGATAITVALPVGVRFPTLVVRYSSPTVAGWLATPLTH
ncbi:MAG TPA: hypothetical protein PLV92_21050, partial [Pirellulaceae bacterium]|nr:hypothetical protein [Pirellulaceae bacterium]